MTKTNEMYQSTSSHASPNAQKIAVTSRYRDFLRIRHLCSIRDQNRRDSTRFMAINIQHVRIVLQVASDTHTPITPNAQAKQYIIAAIRISLAPVKIDACLAQLIA